MSTRSGSRAWVEVDAEAIRQNLITVRRRIGSDAVVLPMVKADGYGVGVQQLLETLEPLEPYGYGVATVDEGRRVRDLGVKRPVLVFSPVPGSLYPGVLEANLTLCLSDPDALGELAEGAKKVERTGTFHIEVDTGIGRSGWPWKELEGWRQSLSTHSESDVQWTGCFTHFHSADLADSSSVLEQWARFKEALQSLPVPDADPFLIHACNSAAALRHPEFAADGVRPGIFLYGGVAGEDLEAPRPAVSVKARVILTREAPPGTTVGYGATHRAKRGERWATLAIGYGDGLPRQLGNRGHALLHGQRAPIVGRISMDVTVVDITDVPSVKAGDVATVIGTDGGETISLEEVAELASTINYEILTGLSPRLPRVWVNRDGE